MTAEDKFIEGNNTVANWIAMLKELPQDAVLKFCISQWDSYRALSPPYEEQGEVWVDLEEEKE